jgi:hypothetical protein
MNLIRFIPRIARRSLILAALSVAILPTASRAEFASIAYGSKDAWGWAVRETRKEADAKALALCNEDSKSSCQLAVDKALVKAEGKEKVGYGRSVESVAKARDEALKSCGEPSCQVTKVWADAGFYSVAKPKESGGTFYVVYGGVNSGEVDKEALSHCEEQNGTTCLVVWSRAIEGKLAKPAHVPQPAPVGALATGDCRPNTREVRCSSRCTNGSCVVSYENGCKIHVQVAPVFDSFSNQWTYPSPNC